MNRVEQLAALKRIRSIKRVRGVGDLRRARSEADVAKARLADATQCLAVAKETSARIRSANLASGAGGLPGHLVVGRLERQIELDAAVVRDDQGVRDAQHEQHEAQRWVERTKTALGELLRREEAVGAAHSRSLGQQVIESEACAEVLSEEEHVSSPLGASA